MLYLEDAEFFDELPEYVQLQLRTHQEALTSRAAYKRGNCEWWKFTWPLHKAHFGKARLICPYRARENRFALDQQATRLPITDTTVLYDNGQPEDLRYILGVLNSRLLTARFRLIGKLLGGGVVEYYENTVKKLAIPRAQPGTADHDDLVALVMHRMEIADDARSTNVTAERDRITAEIRTTDDAIEEHVRGLFGLTAEDAEVLYALLNDDD
jgi:hypothetical protein